MKMTLRSTLRPAFILTGLFSVLSITQAELPKDYQGKPFEDDKYKGGAQKIPGKVECAYYDLGGEGVAFHDSDKRNSGSGALNPANGDYHNEFRKGEALDISFAKDGMDDTQYSPVKPPKKQLYVGWTGAGEWFNLTVDVEKAGTYAVDVLYTCNSNDAAIGFAVNGKTVVESTKINSTNDPADNVGWRQWHHWNLQKDIATIELEKGLNLLTVKIVSGGNMNLGYLDFRDKDAAPAAAPAPETKETATEPAK